MNLVLVLAVAAAATASNWKDPGWYQINGQDIVRGPYESEELCDHANTVKDIFECAHLLTDITPVQPVYPKSQWTGPGWYHTKTHALTELIASIASSPFDSELACKKALPADSSWQTYRCIRFAKRPTCKQVLTDDCFDNDEWSDPILPP